MANSLLQDKSLLIFGLSTISIYLLLKGLKRVLKQRQHGVLKLIIYPIKSVPGVEVDHLEVTPTGVTYEGVHDRALMLLNEHKNLVSLRTKPTLACIETSFEGDSIVLRAPSMPPLVISPNQDVSANEQISFSFWNQDTTGVEYSQEASAWFSLYLRSTTKLVKFQPSTASLPSYRKTDIHTDEQLMIQDASLPIVYQDECALALNNEASLSELNRRLKGKGRAPVSYRNFRPNVLVRAGGEGEEDSLPFAEDTWRRLQLGPSVVLQLAKPCHRCTTTTTDPDSGRKNADFEPLETLKEFRIKPEWTHLYGSSPIFGLSLSPVALGTLRLGDRLKILEKSEL